MRSLILALFMVLLFCHFATGIEPTTGPVSPDGKAAICDIPATQHIRNVVGSDGAGLCVFTSAELMARWQNQPSLFGLQAWMRKRPGGGYPTKLDQVLAKYTTEKNVPLPQYIQHTGGDDAVLDLALRTGRMPCVTYAGRDDFYRSKIAHMVNLVHLDQTTAAIVDNNRPGQWVWMTRAEFLSRWRDMQGGWAVILLDPPPPPKGPVTFEQCQGGRCPPPSAPPAYPFPAPAPETPSHQWHGPYGPENDPFYILKSNGVDAGLYSRIGWKPAIGPGTFEGEPRGTPPVQAPTIAAPPTPPAPEALDRFRDNYGVDPSQIHDFPSYSISGVECDRKQALDALALSDDSSRYHLTIVTDDEAVKRSAITAAATLPGRDRVHLQCYRSSDWAVAARALAPGLTLQKPRATGGTVVLQNAEVTPETVNEAIARTDPNWKPKAPLAPGPPGPVVTINPYLLVFAILAIAAWVYFKRS
jgi:hypothetical protein